MGKLKFRVILHADKKQFPKSQQSTARVILKDETTFELSDMERKERWKYYTSSFVRVEPTEGVPRDRVRKSVLTRNLPSGFDSESDSDSNASQHRKPFAYNEGLVLRICVNTYQLTYKKETEEWFLYKDIRESPYAAQVSENRNQRFREKFEMNSKWIKNLTQGQVQAVNEGFEKWVRDGIIPGGVAIGRGSATAV
jgi:paired amphipathic helix protein Sin3a